MLSLPGTGEEEAPLALEGAVMEKGARMMGG